MGQNTSKGAFGIKKASIEQRGFDLVAEGYKNVFSTEFDAMREMIGQLSAEERDAQCTAIKAKVADQDDLVDLMFGAEEVEKEVFQEKLNEVDADVLMAFGAGLQEMKVVVIE